MGKTSIEWTDRTWNPVRGCSRVSEGCRNCYAERQAARFAAPEQPAAYKAGPFHGFVQITNGHPQWTGKVELVEKHLMDPLHWKKPQRVFVNSMSDLFHEALPDEAIDRVFAVMALCPQHTFQVLTKRPERMNRYVSGKQHGRMCKIARQIPVRGEKPNARFPLSNVWLGVSVEDQKTADERIPLLLQTPAAVRFVSYEPALGPVDFDETRDWLTWNYVYRRNRMNGCMNTIDQVIVGGESGPGARPFNIEWARNVIAQCKDAGTKVFFKQAGSNPVLDNNRLHLNDRKGGDLSELPSDIGLREYPDAV